MRSAATCPMTTALLTGFGLGFLVAAQVGPISLLAARSVILGRLTIGIMIGLGAAVLIALGALALRHATRAGNQAQPSPPITSAPRAYLTALGATAANPLTIASWAAVFAAASAAHISRTTTGAALLLAGIGLGTASWFTALSTAMALVRRLAGRRVHQAIDVISGLGLIAFGMLLAWQATAAASP